MIMDLDYEWNKVNSKIDMDDWLPEFFTKKYIYH